MCGWTVMLTPTQNDWLWGEAPACFKKSVAMTASWLSGLTYPYHNPVNKLDNVEKVNSPNTNSKVWLAQSAWYLKRPSIFSCLREGTEGEKGARKRWEGPDRCVIAENVQETNTVTNYFSFIWEEPKLKTPTSIYHVTMNCAVCETMEFLDWTFSPSAYRTGVERREWGLLYPPSAFWKRGGRKK